MSRPLSGIGVLLTRPVQQSQRLAGLVADLGAEPVLFPAMEIEPLPEGAFGSVLKSLPQYDVAVFVSPNAVRIAMPRIEQAGGLRADARVAAVGPGTAAELKKSGVHDIILPQESIDTEGLLDAMSQVRLAGSRVLIIRGRGGRELLRKTLQDRGAKVEYLECYRRIKPAGDMEELLPRWQRGGIRACVATSSEIAANLFDMAGDAGRPWLCRTPFFVSHPRIAAAAFALGVRTVFVAGAGDHAMASGLETWFARLRTDATVA